MSEERLAALEAQIHGLAARVAALEPAQPTLPPAAGPNLDLLHDLMERRGAPFEQGDVRGALMYAGGLRLGGATYAWQREPPLPALLALEPEGVARVLAALSNPARITLVRALMRGPCNSQQLQAALGDVSTGQLYHHLKELRAAGVIEQHGRSDYRLAAEKIVPFLIILAAACEFVGGGR